MWRKFVTTKFGELIGGGVAYYSRVCVDFFLSVRGDVCCDSHHVMTCISNLLGWLCWEGGLVEVGVDKVDKVELIVKIYECLVLSLLMWRAI